MNGQLLDMVKDNFQFGKIEFNETMHTGWFWRKLDQAIGSLASFRYDILISVKGDLMAGKDRFHGRHFPKCIVGVV